MTNMVYHCVYYDSTNRDDVTIAVLSYSRVLISHHMQVGCANWNEHELPLALELEMIICEVIA